MREEFLKKISDEEKIIKELLRVRYTLESYDEIIEKSKKELLEKIAIYIISFTSISIFSSTNLKIVKTLIPIMILSVIDVIEFYVTKSGEEKKINAIDIEALEIGIYNSEEKMKGLSNALFLDLMNINDSEENKVYCKK